MGAGALSRKSMGSLEHTAPARRLLLEESHKLESKGVHFELGSFGLLLTHVWAQSSLIKQIKAMQ